MAFTTSPYQQVSIASARGPMRSASIASLSGSSQTLIQATNAFLYILIQNPPTNANNVGINLVGGTAAIGGIDTIVLLPGGSFFSAAFQPTNGVTCVGTAADVLVAMYA